MKQKYLKAKAKYNQECDNQIKKTLSTFKNTFNNNDIDLESFSINEIEEVFGNMLLKALQFMKEVYKIDTDWIQISENAFLEITYTADGKNFLNRIKEYCDAYKIDNNEDSFLNNISRLLKTESRYIFNHLLDKEIRPAAIEAEIIGDNACDGCLDHLGGGKGPISLFKDIPPFHPNCECSLIYYLNIDEDVIDGEN